MNCIHCEKEMKVVSMLGDMYGMNVYLEKKSKRLLGSTKRSPVDCYVCTQCGYVELKAQKPQVFDEV